MARNLDRARIGFPLPKLKLSPRLPLRTILIIPFVLQTVSIAAIVGYLSYQNGQNSVDELARSLEKKVTHRISDRLDAYLAIPHQINQINAAAHELGTLDLLNFKTTGQYFWRQREIFQVSTINFATLKGEYIGAIDFGDGKYQIEEIPLNTRDKSYRYLTDRQGNREQLFSEQKYNPLSEVWFTNTLQQKKPNWSEIYNWDGYPEILSLSANYPIYNRNAQLIGVAGVDLKLTNISDFLSGLKIGNSSQAFIIERSGMLVASSVKEPPYLIVNGKTQRLPALKSRNAAIRETTAALQREVWEFDTLQSDRQLTLEIAGQKKYVQIAPWQDKMGLDWLVVVAIPESDFMGQIYANNRRTILLSGIALLIAVALGILTARWIANPVRRLSKAARVLAQAAGEGSMDNVNASPTVSPIEELETLSASFYQMSDRLQESFGELEAANQELEDRVAQRTADLQEANLKIAELNQQLRADNLRMSAELDVTRRLQQMMLPNAEELESLEQIDIACFMEPAQEVGGDYYDVIQGDRQIAIGIGDVTGHGLESGVLAIMAQTALRTLLAANMQEPVILLNALNQVLYENVQRLSPGKNMTFGLFQYRNGQLRICGQHEEVLVFRANGETERIDTLELGMPLGTLPDIREFVSDTQITLASGDGVVLYSDGIPEAEGVGRSLYGIERLIETVRQNWGKSAREIQHIVIEDVRSHIGALPVYDDITLVVLKQT